MKLERGEKESQRRRKELQDFKKHHVPMWGPPWAQSPRWTCQMGPPMLASFGSVEHSKKEAQVRNSRNLKKKSDLRRALGLP